MPDSQPRKEVDPTEREIREKIAQSKQKFGEYGWWPLFNNLVLNLPNRTSRDDIGYRTTIENLGYMDIPFGEKVDKHERSEKFLLQTPREFFATVDETIENSGINMNRYWQLVDKYYGDNPKTVDELERNSNISELYELLVPAIASLIRQGYRKYDFTA